MDEVLDVLRLASNRIMPTADVLPKGLGQVPTLKGLAHTLDGTVLLLDVDHLLLPVHRKALAQAVATLPEAVAEETLTEREREA